MWQCPLCHTALQISSSTWQCASGHTFDRAKSGYVNLHPVQHKRSRQPGDDKAMLRARRQFHQSGGYQPLMAALTEMVRQCVAGQSHAVLYDAGCGEGAYLKYCVDSLHSDGLELTAAGSDIAKLAVEMAAKSVAGAQFVVASSVSLPVADGSLSVILQVFAPGRDEEYHRALQEEGYLITVDPGPDHLWELKQRVYARPQQHQAQRPERLGFRLADSQRVQFTLTFSSPEQRDALLSMTPYVWRLDDDKRTQLTTLTAVSADFDVRLWQKCAPAGTGGEGEQ